MKVLFIYNTNTSWTNNDFEILSRKHLVTRAFIKGKKSVLKHLNPFLILQNEVLVFWFASFSFLPILLIGKFFRRKVVFICGGYDGASVPEIGYGAFARSSLSKAIRRWMFHSADKISCISNSYSDELVQNTGISKKKTTLNYLGFSSVSTPLTPWNQREKIIVTIGGVNQETYLRKGIKYFVELSDMLPDWKFFIIGRANPEMRELIEGQRKNNLEMTGFMEDKAMSELLNKSKFYLQLSHHEAFGASVIDAALMGCYPIVYNKGALKEVVDREGSVFELNELIKVKDEILKLANSNINVEEKRNFYQKKYSKEKRAELLLASLDQI
jgi:glycosyltransferase involved in cell wall biosynthesis